MRNSLGNPARGDAFYPRTGEIRKIYRVLRSGVSIYLAAPRRVGKTSILKYLEEFPENEYCFIYLITESVDNQNDFFNAIFDAVVSSEAIRKLAKITQSAKESARSVLSTVKSIGDVELREPGKSDYFHSLLNLLTDLKGNYTRIVIMIDEFPQTIQNIMEKSGTDAAENFLQKNRELRHHRNVQEKISFIYTGSISLFPMVEKVTPLTAVNDLKTIVVDPLAPEEAKDFVAKLLMEDNLVLESSTMDYLIQKIKWLIPFHIQLIVQEIVDTCELPADINESSIDIAFDQVIQKKNKPQFEPYFSRLAHIFKKNEYEFTKEILVYIAENDVGEELLIYDLGVKHEVKEIKNILEILENDGYLTKIQTGYRYTSPFLQEWCRKHISI